ncbi:MAG: Asp-tRNA(Asn)/Glu-tRNA(Gln) amidotransferase subunit GatB [Cyclobacteriaceae bacterium]
MSSPSRHKYKAVIGLEVHAQLLTNSKIFSADATNFGAPANTNVSVVSLAHPGTLPKLNKAVVEKAIRMGLACRCEISRHNIFDRKNYFYPDLSKGYQITQDRTPICRGGFIQIQTSEGSKKQIRLNRIHMEEDAGKLIHPEGSSYSQVDFNRAGVPLIEIVTEPCIESATDAGLLLSEIRRLVRYLDICDGNMEEGSLRCDANVSVMLKEATTFGKKVEIKNMNSVRNVVHAIGHEVDRQIQLLETGNQVNSETRTFDASTGKTYGMRTKEELNDYRYFPDPDLSPFVVTDSWLDAIRQSMPALPEALVEQFTGQFKLPDYDAHVLTESRELAQYFQEVAAHTSNYKAASNWLMGPVKSYINDHKISAAAFPLPAAALAKLMAMIDAGKVSHTVALQKIFPELLRNPEMAPDVLAEEMNLLQDSDEDSLRPVVDQVIKEFPLKVEEFKSGKKGIVQMFMGEVMKRTRGKADPRLANEMLMERLKQKR